MARYERDYGRDFGPRDPGYRRQSGGMNPDGWGGRDDWSTFGSEEGWYGAGGRSGTFDRHPYDVDYRDSGFGGRDRGGLFGRPSQGRDDFRGYDSQYRSFQGGRSGGAGRGRDDYSDSREDQYGARGGRGGLFGQGQGRDRYRAADIMTENPHTVTPEATISDVARRMRDLDVGIIPVVDSEDSRRLKGVITDRDIAVRAVAEGKTGTSKVSECMTERVRHVNKNDSVQDVMRVMRQEQVRRVPVTDREGRLVGIIAQADLAVDYASDDSGREHEVGEMLEHISEPARPQREGNRMAAAPRHQDERNDVSS